MYLLLIIFYHRINLEKMISHNQQLDLKTIYLYFKTSYYLSQIIVLQQLEVLLEQKFKLFNLYDIDAPYIKLIYLDDKHIMIQICQCDKLLKKLLTRKLLNLEEKSNQTN
ncbi:hypothetical protein pb186bvf_002761 [Paramecium bursaria]